MKILSLFAALMLSENLISASSLGEKVLKTEEIQLSIIESTIYTVGELQPGIHDLLFYSFDPYLKSIIARIHWAFYTDGLIPDQQRIEDLTKKYQAVRSNLIRETKPIIFALKNDEVEKKVAAEFKNSVILSSGCASDTWSYTFNAELTPSSRYQVLTIAYKKPDEAFIRVDHVIYRERNVGGIFNENGSIETYTSEWVLGIEN